MDGVGESEILDRAGDELDTCAVDGGVDNLEVFVACDGLGAQRELLDLLKIYLVDILADNLDFGLVALELDLAHVLDAVHVVDDVDVVGGDDLCAVLPVCLVSVIDLGVGRKLSKR